MPFHDALAPLRNLKHQVYANPSKKRSSTGVSPSSASVYPSASIPSTSSLAKGASASASSSTTSLVQQPTQPSVSSSSSSFASLRPRAVPGPKRSTTRSKPPQPTSSSLSTSSSSSGSPAATCVPAPLTPAKAPASAVSVRLSKEYRAKAALIQQEEWKKALRRDGSINGGGAAGSGRSRILFEDEYKEDVLIYMRKMEVSQCAQPLDKRLQSVGMTALD